MQKLLTAGACSCALLVGSDANADQSAFKEIDIQLNRLVAGYESRDVTAIMVQYALRDDIVVFDVTPPLQFTGYKTYSKSYDDFYAAFPGPVSVDVKQRQIFPVGDLAYTHEINTWTVVDAEGRPTTFTARETYVFQKIGGKWLIVHEHASVPSDVTTGRAALNLKP